MKAPCGSPSVLGDLLDLGQARACRPPPARPARGGSSTGCGVGRGDLDVGGVAGRQRHLVLARRAGRHVLVGAGAAHHPDVGLDPVPAQPAAVEDPLVGARLQLVGARQALLVAVEGVGVLHRELARAQDAGARPRLVALLGLDVEEHQRQVAVGADLAGDVVGDRLLVGHRQHHRRPLAVLELEQLVDRVAPGLLPGSAGCSTGISISWQPIASISSRMIASTFAGPASRRADRSRAPPPAAGSAPPAPSACARSPRRVRGRHP